MDKLKHLLSFVTNSEANMLTVHLDRDGIEFLIARLAKLKELLDRSQCEDCHLFTQWASQRSSRRTACKAMCLDT